MNLPNMNALDGELTPTYEFLLKQYEVAHQQRQKWLNQTTGVSCGVLTLVGSVFPFMLLLGSLDSIQAKVVTIVVYPLLVIGGFNLYNAQAKKNRRSMIILFDQYKLSVRNALFDQGLLAMILLTNPISQFPEISKEMNLFGVPAARYLFDEKSIEQRFKLLIEHYLLLCHYFRLEPYSQWKLEDTHPGYTPPSAGVMRMVVAIVLFEILYHDQEEMK